MSRGVKVLGFVVVLVAVVAIAVPLALQGAVSDAMTRRIAAATGLPTRIGSATLGFFPRPHVEARDIRIGGGAATAPLMATVGSLRFDLSVGSLLGGAPQVSDIALDRPVVTLVRTTAPAAGAREPVPAGLSVDGLTVTDGSFSYVDDARHARLDLAHLNFHATAPGAGAPLTLTGSAQAAGTPLDWRVTVKAPDALATDRTSAADAEFGAPNSPDRTVLHGHFRIAADRIDIPDIAVNAGAASASGSASVDFSGSAPMLTAALKAQRVDFGALSIAQPGAAALPADRSAARLADAAITLDIDEADAGHLKATAIRSRLTLNDGLMRLAISDAAVYGGTLRAEMVVDAALPLPHPTLRASVSNLDVTPLLANVAAPAQFSGRLDAEANLTSAGSSRDELLSNLGGTARFGVHDAVITGVDVPGYIRSVANYLPPAWQRMTNRIDIQSMTASFQIAQGVATTNDLHAVSPVVELGGKGAIDLNAQTFDLSFDPKIAAKPGANGQPATGAGGLGVAVLVQGPWSAPRLSADLSNAMRDPQQTLDTLQTLGQQFLGGDQAKDGGVQADDILKGLGGLLGGLK